LLVAHRLCNKVVSIPFSFLIPPNTQKSKAIFQRREREERKKEDNAVPLLVGSDEEEEVVEEEENVSNGGATASTLHSPLLLVEFLL
jgi:hypothetical protein